MESTGLILLSRQNALQRQMDVLANNMANANTTAYKNQQLILQTQSSKTSFDSALNFVMDRATIRDTKVGPMVRTGNDLDFALQGEGYFGVKTKDGIRYTRSGSFSLNNKGDLVTQDGESVMSSSGQALNVPVDATAVYIDAAGRLLSDKGEIGRLKVTTFKNEQAMKDVGNSLYQTDDDGQDAKDTRVVQGALEQSNVKPVIAMTLIADVVRAYQQTSTTMQNEHERQRTALRTLGRVTG